MEPGFAPEQGVRVRVWGARQFLIRLNQVCGGAHPGPGKLGDVLGGFLFDQVPFENGTAGLTPDT
jgi:hypothetical protein